MNPIKTSLYMSCPHWSLHSIQQTSKKTFYTAEDHKWLYRAYQNTFGRKINTALLWYQGTSDRKNTDYILLSSVCEKTEAN